MKKIIILLGLILFPITLASCGSNPQPDTSVYQTQIYTEWLSDITFSTDSLGNPNTAQNHNAIFAPSNIEGSLVLARSNVSSNMTSDRFISLSVNFLATTSFSSLQSPIINATRNMELPIYDFDTPNSLDDLVLSDIQNYIDAANNDETVFLNVVYMPIRFERNTNSGAHHTTMLVAFVLVPVFFTLSIGAEIPTGLQGIDQVQFGFSGGNLTNIIAV